MDDPLALPGAVRDSAADDEERPVDGHGWDGGGGGRGGGRGGGVLKGSSGAPIGKRIPIDYDDDDDGQGEGTGVGGLKAGGGKGSDPAEPAAFHIQVI